MKFLDQRQSIITYNNNCISYLCPLLPFQVYAIKAKCYPVHAKGFLHYQEEEIMNLRVCIGNVTQLQSPPSEREGGMEGERERERDLISPVATNLLQEQKGKVLILQSIGM